MTNCCVSAFSRVEKWQDDFQTVKARYFLPADWKPHSKLLWYQAMEYCQYYIYYVEPRLRLETPPTLAIGLNGEELANFKKFDEVNKNGDKMVIGIDRDLKSRSKDMRLSAYPHLKVPQHSSWLQWHKSQPVLSGSHRTTCLNQWNGLRYDVQRFKEKPFICARYTISNKPKDELRCKPIVSLLS